MSRNKEAVKCCEETTNKVGTSLRKDGYQGVLLTLDASITFSNFSVDLIVAYWTIFIYLCTVYRIRNWSRNV